MNITHYDTLKVHRQAPQEVIKAAYKSLAHKYHPDKNLGNPEATHLMMQLNQAYEVLSDPIKRIAYDRWIVEQELKQQEKQRAEQEAKNKQFQQSYNAQNDIAITLRIDGSLFKAIKKIATIIIKMLFDVVERFFKAWLAPTFAVLLTGGVLATILWPVDNNDYIETQHEATTDSVMNEENISVNDEGLIQMLQTEDVTQFPNNSSPESYTLNNTNPKDIFFEKSLQAAQREQNRQEDNEQEYNMQVVREMMPK